jgi:hypothetical protein
MFSYSDRSKATATSAESKTEITLLGCSEQEITSSPPTSASDFVSAVLGDQVQAIHHLSRESISLPDGAFPAPKTSLLYQSAYIAFGEHYALRISPQLLWYTVCHEAGTLVGLYPDKYRHLFTDSAEKKKIQVRDDSLRYGEENDWGRSIQLVRGPLRELINSDILDIFLPKFSGMTQEDEVAILVCFMETISSYYEFEWSTMCGIPRIVVEGTAADWMLFSDNLTRMSALFAGDELDPYFQNITSIVAKIATTVAHGVADEDFWESIFKVDNMSGGPYMNGWLASFAAYSPTPSGPKLRTLRGMDVSYPAGTEDFPAHLSQVPFVWNYLGTEIPMMFVSGIMGVEASTEIAPKLGFGVVELKNS